MPPTEGTEPAEICSGAGAGARWRPPARPKVAAVAPEGVAGWRDELPELACAADPRAVCPYAGNSQDLLADHGGLRMLVAGLAGDRFLEVLGAVDGNFPVTLRDGRWLVAAACRRHECDLVYGAYAVDLEERQPYLALHHAMSGTGWNATAAEWPAEPTPILAEAFDAGLAAPELFGPEVAARMGQDASRIAAPLTP